MSGIKKIALDTNIFIYYLEKNPRYGQKAKKIFERIKAQNLQVVCSSLVWAELIAKSGVGSDKDRVDDLRLNLFGMPGLGVVSADVAVCELAGKLKSNYNIHLPDAIHIATGICSECDFFVSFDKKLKKVKEIKVVSSL